jgi:hypothetical protein
MKHDIAFDTEKNSMLIPYRNPDEELMACKQITLLLDEEKILILTFLYYSEAEYYDVNIKQFI